MKMMMINKQAHHVTGGREGGRGAFMLCYTGSEACDFER